jgi:predicted oxidoreductase
MSDQYTHTAGVVIGGVHLLGTPHQRRLGIRDSPQLAWEGWQRTARHDDGDEWPRAWGRCYREHSREYTYEFLHHRKVRFLPFVNWPEPGHPEGHNAVLRCHIAWGTGIEIVRRVLP